MATGYTSRMIRAGVGRQITPARPLPTEADFSARIFDQAWSCASTPGSVTCFAVLALDADHARELGERRLVEMYGAAAGAGLELRSSAPRTWSDSEALGDLLAAESFTDREERQARFTARERR